MISLELFENFNPNFEAVGCFLEHEDAFVLLERQDHKPQGRTWGLPSGKIEEGETPDEAMLRELWQETGYRVSSDSLLHVRTVYVRFDDGTDFVYHIYRLIVSGERPTVRINSAEHKTHEWVSPAEALDMPLIEDLDRCIKLVYPDNRQT